MDVHRHFASHVLWIDAVKDELDGIRQRDLNCHASIPRRCSQSASSRSSSCFNLGIVRSRSMTCRGASRDGRSRDERNLTRSDLRDANVLSYIRKQPVAAKLEQAFRQAARLHLLAL